MSRAFKHWGFLRVSWLAFVCGVATASPAADGENPFPELTGRYAVGRTSFDWVDETRGDTAGAKGHRELIVWLWYPATPRANAKPAQWMPGKWGELFWQDFLRRYADAEEKGKQHPIQNILTHSYSDAPPASSPQPFPVLLFAPGKGNLPLEYASLIEDIVSHGYVVAGIVPTGDANFTVFPDGRVVRDKPSALMPPPPGAGGMQQFREFQAKIEEEMAQSIHEWSADLNFTLNQLKKLDADTKSPLHGRLNLQRVGAFGHSQGGAASLQWAESDARVRAVFDIDGMLSPQLAAAGSLSRPIPVLVLNSDMIPRQAMANNKLQSYAPLLQSAKPGYQLRLAGSVHYFSADFGFLPFLPDSARSGAGIARRPMASLVGSIEPSKALTVTKAYATAFFDSYLKEKESPLLGAPSRDYPEISVEFPR